MSLFSLETINAIGSIEAAWKLLSAGAQVPHDKRLLPDELDVVERIVWLERLRQFALKCGSDLAILSDYRDFREYALERRPDPTWDQWIWLYQQIGERHRKFSLQDAVRIMACRDGKPSRWNCSVMEMY